MGDHFNNYGNNVGMGGHHNNNTGGGKVIVNPPPKKTTAPKKIQPKPSQVSVQVTIVKGKK